MDTPLFETERLLARRWRLEDAEAAFRIYGDPEVTRYLGGGRVETSVDDQRAVIAKILAQYDPVGLGSWPLVEKATGELVGTILLKPLPDHAGVPCEDIEIGWHLARRAWGRGFATEAGRACLAHAFGEVGLDLVHAVVEPPNEPSKAVARRLGMRHEGQTRRYYRGTLLDLFTLRAPRCRDSA